MKNKKFIIVCISLVIIIVLIIILFNINKKESVITDVKTVIEDVEFTPYDLDDSIPDEYTSINLDEKTSNISISKGGVYLLTGSLKGSIIIDTKNDVRLILDNVNIKSNDYSAIYVENANKVVITLKEGTINYIEDSSSYKNLDTNDEPNATIFSHDDLVFNGIGTLEIKANYEDAITSKDGLKIASGIYKIESKDDGIRGKDYLYILDGTFNIDSSGDSLKSTNDKDSSLGYIKISNGTYKIKSNNDGINATTNIYITDGIFDITTTSLNTTDSTKGLKAQVSIQIDSGTFNINTKDDSIHSNSNIVINGGSFELESEDDAIHADDTLKINGGYINVINSYEGLEANDITVNDGEIYVVASDDGINAAGGNDSSGFGPRKDNFNSSESSVIEINNGYIYVNSKGDGIDSNGSIIMNDGTLIVDGPTDSGNGALDFDLSFNVNGGILIATGSSGMAQTPSNSSNQNIISINSKQSANTLITIKDSEENEIISFAPSKSYSSFIVSTPSLKNGEKYNIYYGGTCLGISNKLCTSSSNQTFLDSISISTTITNVGSQPGMQSPNNGGNMNEQKRDIIRR